MKNNQLKVQMFGLLATALIVGCASTTTNHAPTVSDCKIRATIPGASATGAFLTIHSPKDGVNLISADISDLAKVTEIHEMVKKNGVMSMSQIDHLALNEGDNQLQPGGYHLMLMGLKQAAVEGDQYEIKLSFDNQTEASCIAPVKDIKKGHSHGKM